MTKVAVEMLQSLTEQAQCFMTYADVVGKSWYNTVRLKHAGRLRKRSNQPWMPMIAKQRHTTTPLLYFEV